MSDYTYVENVAHALICAEAALGSHMVIVSGKVLYKSRFLLWRALAYTLGEISD